MSIVYKSKVATLSNYLELFKDFSPDIQDEVRSALLDDTQISSYIDKCRDDSFRLNQIRLAVREFVPAKYISSQFSCDALFLVRKAFREGFDLGMLDTYLPKRGILPISEETLEKLLIVMLKGVDISKVDFRLVPNSNLDLICQGLEKGYPMWLFVGTESRLSNEMIRVLMRGLALELDIHPFLNGAWGLENLTLLFLNATKLNYTVLMKHINYKFSYAQLFEIVSLAQEYYDFLPLCLKDEDGSPIFNDYQMHVLAVAIRENIEVDEEGFLVATMSDIEMEEKLKGILEARAKSEGRKLAGRLPKGVK